MADKIVSIKGKTVPVKGSDIDTDRIIPARYLRCTSFEGLRGHAFEDDRLQMKEKGALHPFDDPKFANAEILIAGSNFGCGSSREHAPQALRRWNKGIKAIVAESFAEIFFGNCTTLGIPCLRAAKADIERMWAVFEASPDMDIEVNLEKMTASFGKETISLAMSEGPRRQLLEGRFDPTDELLDALDQIRKKAKSIPYFGW